MFSSYRLNPSSLRSGSSSLSYYVLSLYEWLTIMWPFSGLWFSTSETQEGILLSELRDMIPGSVHMTVNIRSMVKMEKKEVTYPKVCQVCSLLQTIKVNINVIDNAIANRVVAIIGVPCMSLDPRIHNPPQIFRVRELGSFCRALASSSSRTSNSSNRSSCELSDETRGWLFSGTDSARFSFYRSSELIKSPNYIDIFR